jgi:hypothetical protein
MVSAKRSGRKGKRKKKKTATKLSQEEKLYLQGDIVVIAHQDAGGTKSRIGHRHLNKDD